MFATFRSRPARTAGCGVEALEGRRLLSAAMLKDVNPGGGYAIPDSSASPLGTRGAVEVNGVAYFTASDGRAGAELWRSDGTAAGTWMVKDAWPGSTGSDPRDLTDVGGTLYFVAWAPEPRTTGALPSLWKSDGTAEGTKQVRPVISESHASFESATLARPFVAWGGYVFFVSKETPEATDLNYELWRSDGTDAGTVRVKDILPGPGYGVLTTPFAAAADGVYFLALDGVHGRELWKSDGTEAGTVMVTDLVPGTGSPSLTRLAAVGSTLFFSFYDQDHGTELWKTDGTPGGTAMVKDIADGTTSSAPAQLTPVNGTLFFTAAARDSGTELWKSDGTAAGTVLVKDLRPGSSAPTGLTAFNGRLLFKADGTDGSGLWTTDGTGKGTVFVKKVIPYSDTYTASGITAVGETAYFQVRLALSTHELWKTDGTPAGTAKVTSTAAGFGVGNGSLTDLSAVGDTLYLASPHPQYGREWWTVANDPPGLTAGADAVYTLTGPADHKRLAVTAGTVTLTAEVEHAYSSLAVEVSGAGAVAITSPLPLAALTLNGPGASATFGGTSDLAGLSFAGGRSLVSVPVVSTPLPPPSPPRKPPALSVADVRKAEGRTGLTAFTFAVTLDRPGDKTIRVRYATANKTAARGVDYLAAAGTLVFRPGETRKLVTVWVKGDKAKEADETFFLNLFAPVNATLGRGQAKGVLRNDD